MDYRSENETFALSSPTSALACVFLTLYALHLAWSYFDAPILSLTELVWNSTVSVLPAPLLLDSTQRRELRSRSMRSQIHAAKSDALRKVLGLGGNAVIQTSSSAGKAFAANSGRRQSYVIGAGFPAIFEAPAGLGNWDNSCYQNSVLQSLAALDTLPSWLRVAQGTTEDDAATTNKALHETIMKLRDPTNNGSHLWTPAKLKNMSSWQQQDAQEYFSKVMDELDKEAAKAAGLKALEFGLEAVLHPVGADSTSERQDRSDCRGSSTARNPLEGLIAQRVACTSCGFSEGYSMIPFNCLTVPLGSSAEYNLAECLNEYTKQEAIDGVECRRCTLLRAEEKIKSIAVSPSSLSTTSDSSVGDTAHELPPEVRAQIAQRLLSIQTALADDDYTDKALKQDCQIPAKSYVNSVKTREALVGRAPQTLVVHINRSMFDEMTGVQRKNCAHVRYPLTLDLSPWMLEMGNVPTNYKLRAFVTHHGRHENGHYICYRQHPTIDRSSDKPSTQWWRLSDEEVSLVTGDDIVDQGGVFMLFYERDPDPRPVPTVPVGLKEGFAAPVAEIKISPPEQTADITSLKANESDEDTLYSMPVEPASSVPSSSQSTASESDTDYEYEDATDSVSFQEPFRPQAPVMRTAPPVDVRHDFGFGRSFVSV